MTSFSGVLPLFPLPNVVLFPEMLLPLHLFEPRYRELARDALAGERRIGMALLKPGWEEDYHGNPPIHDVVGAGRIVQDRKLPDGRYNILLRGFCRARVVEIVTWTPYRTARVESMADLACPPGAEEDRLRDALLRHARARTGLQFPDNVPLGALADVLAATLDVNLYDKQKVLEELDVLRRAGKVLALAELVRKRWEYPPKESRN